MLTGRRSKAFQVGFSLLEVLIAVVILSFGLLGLAGLQANSLKNNHSAYLRSQAVWQAYDMADRMRANRTGLEAGAYDDVEGIPENPNCEANACSAAQMAQYDAALWNGGNATRLPAGAGTVTAQGGGVYDIAVSWQDREGGEPVTKTFTTRVRP